MTPDELRTALRRIRRRIARHERETVPEQVRLAQAARAAGIAIAEIAHLLGITRQHAHRLVHGRHDR